MENNLENRPKLDDVYDYNEASRRKAIDKLYEMEEWFLRFEKELRDILTIEMITLPDGSKRCLKVVSIFEILGETP